MPDPRPPYWFPAKRYGWGWGLPATWQGWVVFLAYLVLVCTLSAPIALYSMPLFFIFLAVLTTVLITICYAKGEPPHWRWGK